MRMLIPLSALGVLQACGDSTQSGENALAASEDRIECAVDGAETFEPVCAVEQEGATLTIRHPSGAFRRLMLTGDGRGLIAADGADPALVSMVDRNQAIVALAGDRYRLKVAPYQ